MDDGGIRTVAHGQRIGDRVITLAEAR
jgi:hypothetical protein